MAARKKSINTESATTIGKTVDDAIVTIERDNPASTNTVALFTEHLEDSPLGHIPKGWTAGTVIEGFNLTMCQSPPGDTYNEESNGLLFYQGQIDFAFRFPKHRIDCSAPTRYIKSGDTLLTKLLSGELSVPRLDLAERKCAQ